MMSPIMRTTGTFTQSSYYYERYRNRYAPYAGPFWSNE